MFGAGGFIGTNLCRRLLGATAQLRAFGRRKSFPAALDGIRWFQGDFTDRAAVAAALEGCTTVVHLLSATNAASANADMLADLKANVAPTLQLLEACRLSGVKKIVFISSGGTVYGITSQIPTPESAPLAPITAYGVSKLSIERYIALYQHLHGIEYAILRVSNPYGPYQSAAKGQGVISAFLQKAIAGETIEIWGDGSVVRDFIYIDDVIDAIVAAICHAEPSFVLNVGSGAGHSLNDIIVAIERLVGHPIACERRSGRPMDVPRSVLDISRAQQELEWSPRVGLDSGLARTLAWMRDVL